MKHSIECITISKPLSPPQSSNDLKFTVTGIGITYIPVEEDTLFGVPASHPVYCALTPSHADATLYAL